MIVTNCGQGDLKGREVSVIIALAIHLELPVGHIIMSLLSSAKGCTIKLVNY